MTTNSNIVKVTVPPSIQAPQYVFTLNLVAEGSLTLPYSGGTVYMNAYVTSIPSGADLSGISIEVINLSTNKAVVEATGSSGSITVPMQFPNNIINFPQSYTVQASASGGILGNTIIKSNTVTVVVNTRFGVEWSRWTSSTVPTSICMTVDNIASQLPPGYFVNAPNSGSTVSSIQGKTTITQSENNFIITVPYPSQYKVPQYYKPTGTWYTYNNLGDNQTLLLFTAPSKIVNNGITYDFVSSELSQNSPEYPSPYVYGDNTLYTYQSEISSDILSFLQFITSTAVVAYASYSIQGTCIENTEDATTELYHIIQEEITPIISPSNPSSVINLSIASAVIE